VLEHSPTWVNNLQYPVCVERVSCGVQDSLDEGFTISEILE